jgi:hypothetical protein
VAFDRSHEKRNEEYGQGEPDWNMITRRHLSGECPDHEGERYREDIDRRKFLKVKRIGKMEKDKYQTQGEKLDRKKERQNEGNNRKHENNECRLGQSYQSGGDRPESFYPVLFVIWIIDDIV